MEDWEKLIPKNVYTRYEFHNFNNAVEILSGAHMQEYHEILDALDQIDIRIDDITAAGGNESEIPKKFSAIMRPRN